MPNNTIQNIKDTYKHLTQALKNGELVMQDGMPNSISMKEVLTTADLNIVMPKAMEVIMLQAAEPEYLASKFVRKITLKEGKSLDIINFGAMRASEIQEGAQYPEQQLDVAMYGGSSSTEIKVKKHGLKIPISEEMIEDSQWDVVGLHLEAAGKAMAREREEVIFNEFSKHGHIIFDTDKGGTWSSGVGSVYTPNTTGLAPTGRGYDGTLNGTLSAQDFLDMCTTIMAAGFIPTDIIVHPLTYSLFASNSMLGNGNGSLGAFGGVTAGQATLQAPKDSSYALPVGGIKVHMSPYVPFSHADKKFDMYIIDRNNAGVLLVKDEMAIDQFSDPARDILNLKVRARYNAGVVSGGMGIAVAKNITFLKTWPAPERSFLGMTRPADMTNAKMDAIEDRALITPEDPQGPSA